MSDALGKIKPRRLSVEMRSCSEDYSSAVFMVYYTDEGRDPVAVGTLTYSSVAPLDPLPEMDQALEYFIDGNPQILVGLDHKCLAAIHKHYERAEDEAEASFKAAQENS